MCLPGSLVLINDLLTKLSSPLDVDRLVLIRHLLPTRPRPRDNFFRDELRHAEISSLLRSSQGSQVLHEHMSPIYPIWPLFVKLFEASLQARDLPMLEVVNQEWAKLQKEGPASHHGLAISLVLLHDGARCHMSLLGCCCRPRDLPQQLQGFRDVSPVVAKPDKLNDFQGYLLARERASHQLVHILIQISNAERPRKLASRSQSAIDETCCDGGGCDAVVLQVALEPHGCLDEAPHICRDVSHERQLLPHLFVKSV